MTHSLLTPTDCTVILVGAQPGLAFAARSADCRSLRADLVAATFGFRVLAPRVGHEGRFGSDVAGASRGAVGCRANRVSQHERSGR